jgi:sigma-B regulation protein RsbU (phosphoserine phosphatase)
VDLMKAGAHDYVLKGSLARLIPAVERELREAANREAKRHADQALRHSELRYRLLWETATDAVLLMDKDSTIHFANPAVEEVFGYRPEEVIGRTLGLLQPERLRATHLEELKRYLCTGVKPLSWRATETVGLRKDGTEIPIEVAFSDMVFDEKRWFVGFIRDVTVRKRIERELESNQEEFRVAGEIQELLFPKHAPKIDGFEIAGESRSAGATGGDYFDYVPMAQGRLGVVVGDVTGHGVGPALLMAETRAYLRVLAKNREDPGEILTRANLVLAEDLGGERYVTLLFVRIDPQTRMITYSNAGHPAGYILSRNGDVSALLKRTGIPLGLRSETRYASASLGPLSPGDIVILLTDGFEETVSPDDRMFGIERVLNVVRENRNSSAAKIVEAMFLAAKNFSQNESQADDLTILVIKVTEPAAARSPAS